MSEMSLKGHIIPPGVSVISRYKPFRKSASCDITSGRVHLDVRWIDQSTSPLSGPWQMSLTYPVHACRSPLSFLHSSSSLALFSLRPVGGGGRSRGEQLHQGPAPVRLPQGLRPLCAGQLRPATAVVTGHAPRPGTQSRPRRWSHRRCRRQQLQEQRLPRQR